MKDSNLPKVLLLHNIVSPYRLPLFEKLSEKVDLTVYFCKTKTSDRKWVISFDKYSFKNEILPEFDIGPFYINPNFALKLLSKKYDLYIVGENPENVFSTFVILIFAKILRKPFIIWSGIMETKYSISNHSTIKLRNFLSKIYKNFIDFYIKMLYLQADAFVVYSKKSKNFIMRLGISEKKNFLGGQVMPKELLTNTLIDGVKEEFRNKTVILYLGYLREKKGIDYLIHAYKNIDFEDSILIIAGSGPDEERLKSLAMDRNDILFVGYVDGVEKARYYSLADIFVFPTLHDSWGLVINEAMYYGLPIITTSSAGASDMIEMLKNGLIADPGNINSLENCLKKLLVDENLRITMGKKSKGFKDAFETDVAIKPFMKAIYFVLNKTNEKKKKI